MVNMAKFATLAAAAAIALTAGMADANAHKAKYRHSHGKCYPAMEARATGQGLFGKGTAEARNAARYEWESKATNRYGDAYGNFDKARGKIWDCKKGAILKAKCVVIARPCL